MTKAVVLADLDDTLFQTRRKIPAHPERGLRAVSALEDGTPSGWATPVQQALLALFDGCLVVPVTARGTAALARVDLPAAPAVCANGGRIVRADGTTDRDWHAHLVARGASAGASVEDVFAALDAACRALDVRRWVVAEDGLGLYAVVKANLAGPGGTGGVDRLASGGANGATSGGPDGGAHAVPPALRALLDGPVPALLPGGWRVHVNGNNLSLSPPWLAKRDAVAYLLPRLTADHPDVPVIGIGDSLSDAGFMDLCHYAMAPTGSQLWSALGRDGAWVPRSGPAAGPTAGSTPGSAA